MDDHRAVGNPTAPTSRRVPRLPRLPSSRALVGGLLVTVAAVGVLAAHAGASGSPGGRWVVAARPLAPGSVLTGADLRVVHGSLPDELVAQGFTSTDELDGATVLAPLGGGELVQRSAVLTDGGADPPPQPAHEFSFVLERERAVNGDLRPGEWVDVLATYGTGGTASTSVVAHRATVLQVAEGTTAIGSSGTVVLTLGVTEPVEVLALTHAVDAAAVTVVRATRTDASLPEHYTPIATGVGAP